MPLVQFKTFPATRTRWAPGVAAGIDYTAAAMSARATPADLPAPTDEQAGTSTRLLAQIQRTLAQQGGWIGFDRYMQQALYEPGLGYYAGGSRKFGAGGDFVTAPELSPLFGQCLAVQLAEWFEHVPPVVWEFGAGSGELAAQLLEALPGLGVERCEYRIVEVSAELRERQRLCLAQRVPEALNRVTWCDQLPESLEGVVLANELLDALPVRVFEFDGVSVYECGVRCTDDGLGLVVASRPADAALSARVRTTLADAGWGAAEPIGIAEATERIRPAEPQAAGPAQENPSPVDRPGAARYRSELGEQAAAWVATLASRLTRGAMLLIDYGFPRTEYYHPQRSQGTLNCHYRHRSHADPLWMPGLCDITAHVDFSRVFDEARRQGLACLGYTSQANFLLACGLPEVFARLQPDDPLERARFAQALQALVSEAEMGELFKVIAFGRGLPAPARGFSLRDRQQAL